MLHRKLLVPSLLAVALSGTGLIAQKAVEADSAKDAPPSQEDLLDLEEMFPEKGFFGPGARGAAFSHDGRYAAYLHRTYKERRHGNDLYLVEVGSGEVTRITSPVLMAAFQADARKVLEDRLKKAKQGNKSEQKGGKQAKDASLSTRDMLMQVGDKDADAEKAPRYGGISSFEWSPNADRMLILSGGDIYHWQVGDAEPTRLTRTQERESGVEWLPKGDGYTYMRDGSLFRIRFGRHLIEQLDPELSRGERISSYKISPDGTRSVLVTTKGQSTRDVGRKVKIASYRDRFVQVREVNRHTADSPLPKSTTTVYLYDLEKGLEERGILYQIHKHEYTGPRDILRTPEWAPDSSRVTFGWFAQDSEAVTVMEALFPTEEEQEEAQKEVDAKAEEAAQDEVKAVETEGENEGAEDQLDVKALTDTRKMVERPAKAVYRFLHNGGPNTPRMVEPRYTSDSRHIVFLSEQSGFRHLHVLDPIYESTRQLTSGRFEVYPIDMNEERSTMWVLATKEHPAQQDVYAVDMEDGGMRRLSPVDGFYSAAAVSPDGGTMLASFKDYGHPTELVLAETTGSSQIAITDSHPDKADHYTEAEPEFFAFKNRHGHEIHGFLFKPDGWQATDQRPLILYTYGGPLGTRKQVTRGNFSSDSYLFAWYMAKKHGMVCATIDPRGMSGYGGVFEKASYEQVGKPQTEDLVDGVKYLVAEHGVDADRVGMHGWSFGGFQTQMCLYTEPDVFACGIAGAGPTEWENYNSWYTTGTIGPSRTGKTDQEKFSLLPLAKNLKSRLLLVHGMEDPNVLYQDTVRVYRELLKAGKETLVELFLDPTGAHGLGGDIKRLNKARKYEEFFVRCLGSEAAEKQDGAEAAEEAEPAAEEIAPAAEASAEKVGG